MTYRFFLYIIKFQFSINNRYIELSISIIIIFLDIPNLSIVNLIFSKILIYRYLSITISIIASSIISKILKYRYLSIFVILLHIQTFQSCIIHYIINNHNSYRYLSINDIDNHDYFQNNSIFIDIYDINRNSTLYPNSIILKISVIDISNYR